MKLLDKILLLNPQKRKWLSSLLTSSIAGALTLWSIYGMGEYGMALFIFIPIFMGLGSTILYGYKSDITQKDARIVSYLTLGIFTLALFLCAIEGLICIIMAAPLGLLLTWLGSVIGYSIIKRTPRNAPNSMLIFIVIIPALTIIEKNYEPTLCSVVSSIEIQANTETVWENVIAFPELSAPKEFIFKTGIAYPISAKMEGQGVGAIRYCNFTTGLFIEPITIWEEGKLLTFNVVEQPATMKEMSFWDIDAPHLHDYFVSKKGQFKLSKLPNGNTLLEGTTWYYHNIKPEIYWNIWSNYIVHKIHHRVLEHIKFNSEKTQSEQSK